MTANAPKTSAAARLQQARLYLCTDSRGLTPEAFHTLAVSLYQAGVDIIQLRDKQMEAAQELEYFAALREAARQASALFAANDRADIATLAGADILHLGQNDLPLAAARQLLPSHTLLGRSTHSPAQAREALQGPADYFCIGPVWPTPTKPGRPAAGIAAVREVAQAARECHSSKPWFAIGDIHAGNLDEVLQAGASRIVVVRAITEAPDPAAAAAALRQRLPQV